MNKKNTTNQSKPYMGNFTSSEIGNMLKNGLLDGEMAKNKAHHEEIESMNELNNDMPNESLK